MYTLDRRSLHIQFFWTPVYVWAVVYLWYLCIHLHSGLESCSNSADVALTKESLCLSLRQFMCTVFSLPRLIVEKTVKRLFGVWALGDCVCISQCCWLLLFYISDVTAHLLTNASACCEYDMQVKYRRTNCKYRISCVGHITLTEMKRKCKMLIIVHIRYLNEGLIVITK